MSHEKTIVEEQSEIEAALDSLSALAADLPDVLKPLVKARSALDTSALVKLYIREVGTDTMLRLMDPAGAHTFAVLGLARVEFRSAVRQRERA